MAIDNTATIIAFFRMGQFNGSLGSPDGRGMRVMLPPVCMELGFSKVGVLRVESAASATLISSDFSETMLWMLILDSSMVVNCKTVASDYKCTKGMKM